MCPLASLKAPNLLGFDEVSLAPKSVCHPGFSSLGNMKVSGIQCSHKKPPGPFKLLSGPQKLPQVALLNLLRCPLWQTYVGCKTHLEKSGKQRLQRLQKIAEIWQQNTQPNKDNFFFSSPKNC